MRCGSNLADSHFCFIPVLQNSLTNCIKYVDNEFSVILYLFSANQLISMESVLDVGITSSRLKQSGIPQYVMVVRVSN